MSLLEGWLSIRAALISESREVYNITVEENHVHARVQEVLERAREKDIAIHYRAREDIHQLAEGQTHGGIVAQVGPRRFKSLAELGNGPSAAFLAMLDGTEDPYNFGQATRALYAAGAHGMILRERNWTTAASTVARASAGASEFMPMAVVQSDDDVLSFVRHKGLELVCTGFTKTSTALYDARLTRPLLLVIGGERRGVSKALLRAADSVVSIPYGRKFLQALDTTSATAVIAFEVMRQRQISRR